MCLAVLCLAVAGVVFSHRIQTVKVIFIIIIVITSLAVLVMLGHKLIQRKFFNRKVNSIPNVLLVSGIFVVFTLCGMLYILSGLSLVLAWSVFVPVLSKCQPGLALIQSWSHPGYILVSS